MTTFQILGIALIALAMALCGGILLVSVIRYRLALRRQTFEEDPAQAITRKLPAVPHPVSAPTHQPGEQPVDTPTSDEDTGHHEPEGMTAPQRALNAPEVKGAGYQESVNDYYRNRRSIDQNVAGLVAMISSAKQKPWEARILSGSTVSVDEAARGSAIFASLPIINRHDLGLDGSLAVGAILVNRLALLSMPIANAGEPVNNIGNTRNRVVGVGSSKVSCTSTERMRELTRAITDETFMALLPYRRDILVLIRVTLASASRSSDFVLGDWVAYAGTQHAVVCKSKQEATDLCEELNNIYLRLIAPDVEAMRAELSQWVEHELREIDAVLAKAPK